MRDVRGYEEKNPEILRHLSSGYPRFVVHPFLGELSRHLAESANLPGHVVWPVTSLRMATALAAHLADVPGSRRLDGEIPAVAHPDHPETTARARLFLQNVGGFLSSRAAEAHLQRLGVRPELTPETLFAGDAVAEIRRGLAPAFPSCPASSLQLAPCGMNAVHAVFRALSERQATRGRTLWIQLGWLYLDTITLLQRFTPTPGDHRHVRNVFDRAALEDLFAREGSRIAGVLAEVPTNPLIQTPDLPWLCELAHRHGAYVVADPSVNSPYNVETLPHADVVVCSLTKYAAHEGDVTAGVAAVNPGLPECAELQSAIGAWLDPVHPRDLGRLAAQIGNAARVVRQINERTPMVAQFLEQHPAVRDVCWALHPESRANYLGLARDPSAIGGMITFSVRGPLEHFYDRVRLPKGPSFGMTTTLISPFMYLAHYDLVTSPEGRADLVAQGIDPELLRLCIGTEPVDAIIGALAEALD